MRRREFIVSAFYAGGLRSEEGEPRTFVYKKACDCEIKADIFHPGGDDKRPAAVWLHGGALIMGSRMSPQVSRMLQTLLHSGFTVVSFDYRLAPETKLPTKTSPYTRG
jgi:acetyl esterase/lipase